MNTLSEQQLDEIHTVVQAALQSLDQHFQQIHLPIVSRGGRTTARAFPAFSYRTFYPPEGMEREPVVAGVDLHMEAEGVRLIGDIVGEDSGIIHYELPTLSGLTSSVAIVEAARELARQLAQQAEVIVRAVLVSPRSPGAVTPVGDGNAAVVSPVVSDTKALK
jgi:hypothetical protein